MEEPLPAGGSCLLGSVNLSEFVKEDGMFDYDEFKRVIPTIVRAMNVVLMEGLPLHPLEMQRKTVGDYRQIGIGIMGLGEMLIKMKIKYGSQEAVDVCDDIFFTLANETIRASANLTDEFGQYPKYKDCILSSQFLTMNTTKDVYELVKEKGLCNSQLLTVAPTGTISNLFGVTGGIEPIYDYSYMRKTESLYNEEVYFKVFTPIVEEYIKENGLKDETELPEYFTNALLLDPHDRIRMQAIVQRHIDASISSTVNLPNEATVDDVFDIYTYAWLNGLKGVTVFRAGCARAGILTSISNTDEEEVEPVSELSRGEWKSLAEDTYYIKRKLSVGCGDLKLFIGYSPSEKQVQDLYIVKCGNGGCTKNLQAVAILMSAVLRLGGSLSMVEKAFCGIEPCNSFVSARAKGKELSKGTYCAIAILNEVNKFLEEIEEFDAYANIPMPKSVMDESLITENPPVEDIPMFPCPECGASLIFHGGCTSCPSCGYQKCE